MAEIYCKKCKHTICHHDPNTCICDYAITTIDPFEEIEETCKECGPNENNIQKIKRNYSQADVDKYEKQLNEFAQVYGLPLSERISPHELEIDQFADTSDEDNQEEYEEVLSDSDPES